MAVKTKKFQDGPITEKSTARALDKLLKEAQLEAGMKVVQSKKIGGKKGGGEEVGGTTRVSIPAPDLRFAVFNISGTAPLVVNRFASKAAIMMKQQEGGAAKRGKARAAKDFEALYKASLHVADPDITAKDKGGWYGFPAAAFRSAMISACRLINLKMTLAKLSVFVEADGINQDGQPIIRIEGTPQQHTSHVRNETGVIDIRSRAMFRKWKAKLRVRYDAAQFTQTDVANLLLRAGIQVGIGEGRPDSKKSAGCGWGTFEIK